MTSVDYAGDRMKQVSYVSQRSGARSTVIALSGVLSALVAILTFIIIPTYLPLGGYDTSSILILSLPILLGVELGTTIVCVGEFVGTVFLILLGFPIYFLPGIVAVRGPEAYLVGKIGRSKSPGVLGRHGRELLAATIGPIWETIGFMIANFYIFYLIGGPAGALPFALTLLPTLLDLIWVPFALALISAIRKWLKTDYMDRQLGLEGAEKTKRSLFISSVVFITITWLILILVPFAFKSWFISTT